MTTELPSINLTLDELESLFQEYYNFKENKIINFTNFLKFWALYKSPVKPADTNVELLEPLIKAIKIVENPEPKKNFIELKLGEEDILPSKTLEEFQNRLDILENFAINSKELDPLFATELTTKKGILHLFLEKIKNQNDRVIDIFLDILENCETSMEQFQSNHEFVSYMSVQPMNEDIFLILYNHAGDSLARNEEIKRAQIRLTYIFLMCSSWNLEIISEIRLNAIDQIIKHFKQKELTPFQHNVINNIKVESLIYFRDGREQLIKAFSRPQYKNNYERFLLKDMHYTLRKQNIILFNEKYNLKSFSINNKFDYLLNHKFLNRAQIT